MKKLLILLTLLVALVTPSFAEYSKAKDDPHTEYVKEQLDIPEIKDVLVQHLDNENTLYHVFDNIENKKPITNEQKKAYNVLMMKYQYIHDSYYAELNESVAGAEEVFSEDIIEYFDDLDGYLTCLDTADEQALKAGLDEYVKAYKIITMFMEPVVSKYEKELAKLEKMTKTYERMF